MCFSTEASFTLSAVLLPAGIYCIRSAIAINKSLLLMAVIPLIFSCQQFCEGIVWLGLGNENLELARTAAMVFLFFALGFWPFWVPFCAFVLEPNGGTRKWILGGITLAGTGIGAMLYLPILWNPSLLVPEAIHHSIYYNINESLAFRLIPFEWWQVLYVVAVAGPPIVSPSRGFFLFGIAIVLSAAVSHVFFSYASTSVWCFIAAALSVYLCFSFYQLPAPKLVNAI